MGWNHHLEIHVLMADFWIQVQNRFLSLSQLLGLPSNETLEIFSRVRQLGGGVGEVDDFFGLGKFPKKSCHGKFAAWGSPKNQYMFSQEIQACSFFGGECFCFVGMGFFERNQDSNTGWSIKSTAKKTGMPGLFTSVGFTAGQPTPM